MAFDVIIVDVMLFSADVSGVGWLLSCIIAAALTVPCILFQRYAYKDSWGIAIAKGMLVGIITAVPTALPAVVTGTGGVMGAIGMLNMPKKLEES